MGRTNGLGNLARLEALDAVTVKLTLRRPDPTLPSKVALPALAIHPAAQFQGSQRSPASHPIGTGAYRLERWDRGTAIVLTRHENYWGGLAPTRAVVFRWEPRPEQRLIELQSGRVDGVDNVAPEQFQTVTDDDRLRLLPREPLNVSYLGFNVDRAPFDNEMLRQAIGHAIDKARLVATLYPLGSKVAHQFLPPAILGHQARATSPQDPDQARQMLQRAGCASGVDLGTLSYRNVVRAYLPQPVQVAAAIRAQLRQVGITVALDEQESAVFGDNASSGKLGLHLLGWDADFADPTNFLDHHFGEAAGPQFGYGFNDLHRVLSQARATGNTAERSRLYGQANALLSEHSPVIPLAHGSSAVAFSAEVDGAHAGVLAHERFARMSHRSHDEVVWLQSAEPQGLYGAVETDGEALRVCEQINESLLSYEPGTHKPVPALAEHYEANANRTQWTFHLRRGVRFHDGTTLNANDVVQSWRVQWDAGHPFHSSLHRTFPYWTTLFAAH